LKAARPIPSVRLVSFGGEAAYRSDVEAAWRLFPSARVRVGLGTTETGALTRSLLDRGTPISSQTIPVGYPYPDKTILVLAEDGTPLGPGEAGEIAVRSRYLAAGYFRRPDLTAAAFQPVPGAPGERLYRTGDLGMWRPDGCLVHLGRKDFQVKIRGFRVDMAEVEGTLLGVPGVRDAAVVTREDAPGEVRLVAYVVPVEPPGPTVSALRRAVAASCPPHMQPSAFVTLPALPMTTGRKVDRSALPRPAPARPLLDSPYLPPRTPVEATLAAIWADVLGLETVGVLDSFGDLGGHSLVAMRLAGRVADAFRVTIPLAALLEAATVEAMALRVVDGLAAAMEPEALARLLAEAEQAPGASGRTPGSS
jgi:acyl carrier protein